MPETALLVNIAPVSQGVVRLSWPAVEGASYLVEERQSLDAPYSLRQTVSGVFPVTEVILPIAASHPAYYRVRRGNMPERTGALSTSRPAGTP